MLFQSNFASAKCFVLLALAISYVQVRGGNPADLTHPQSSDLSHHRIQTQITTTNFIDAFGNNRVRLFVTQSRHEGSIRAVLEGAGHLRLEGTANQGDYLIVTGVFSINVQGGRGQLLSSPGLSRFAACFNSHGELEWLVPIVDPSAARPVDGLDPITENEIPPTTPDDYDPD